MLILGRTHSQSTRKRTGEDRYRGRETSEEAVEEEQQEEEKAREG